MTDMNDFLGYDSRTCEYILHNDKEIFARVGCEEIAFWCKDMGLHDWFIGTEYDCEKSTILPIYVMLYFSQMVFGQIDLNLMTDSHVVRKCISKYVSQ